MFAPKATPKDIVERMRAALEATLGEKNVQTMLTESQQMTLVQGGPDAMGRFLSEQIKVWGDVVRENGIKGAN